MKLNKRYVDLGLEKKKVALKQTKMLPECGDFTFFWDHFKSVKQTLTHSQVIEILLASLCSNFSVAEPKNNAAASNMGSVCCAASAVSQFKYLQWSKLLAQLLPHRAHFKLINALFKRRPWFIVPPEGKHK